MTIHRVIHRIVTSKQQRYADEQTKSKRELNNEKKLYLETDLGVLDIISHVEAVGNINDLFKNAIEIEMYGSQCHLISIDDLIKSKTALGRHRDLVIVEELRAIQSEAVRK